MLALLVFVLAPSLSHGHDPLEAIRAVVNEPNDVNSLEEALEEIGALKDMLKSVIGESEEESSPSPPPQESVEVSATGEQVVQCHTILSKRSSFVSRKSMTTFLNDNQQLDAFTHHIYPNCVL